MAWEAIRAYCPGDPPETRPGPGDRWGSEARRDQTIAIVLRLDTGSACSNDLRSQQHDKKLSLSVRLSVTQHRAEIGKKVNEEFQKFHF